MMSKLADNIYDIVKDLFPNNTIIKEEYVRYQGNKLFFDFFIKDIGVFIEVQGRQHTEFVEHFHGDRHTFLGQKFRDNLKVAYIQENDKFSLVRFGYNEKITPELVKNKIFKALKRDFYE